MKKKYTYMPAIWFGHSYAFPLVIFNVIILTILVIAGITNTKIVKNSDGTKLKTNVTVSSVENDIQNRVITFEENNDTETKTLKQLGIGVHINNVKYVDNLLVDYSKLEVEYNTDNLRSKLEEFNNNRADNKYPEIKQGKNKFKVTESVDGNKLDIERLYNKIVKSLDSKGNISIDLTKFYENKDDTKETYDELSKLVDKVNSTHITYKNGYEIKLTDYIKYFEVVDNAIKIVQSTLSDFTHELDKNIERNLIEYDTVGKPVEFTNTKGKTLKISNGTWGNIFDSDKETEYVIDKFSKFESESDREPIYSQKMDDEIGNTYIEVSIADQHVWHYVNGELCCESDCVTGKLDGRHETPTGVYHILERKNGKTLTPSGASKGTWVNQWMRVTWSGVGLHDAYWRGSFGKSIYKYNGSHGCINLPKNYAAKLYKETYMDMPVVIY